MIHSKSDLHFYLSEDILRFGGRIPTLRDRILHNEGWYIFRYIYHLRHLEYYYGAKGWKIIAYLYHFYCYKRLGFKLRITIYPGTIGPGFRIYHIGDFIHVGPHVKIGKNCTIQPGVVFGRKTENGDKAYISVGDNCYFGLGVKVLGSVRIGNNVIVGANAVVTHDIPDNAVVAGIPARIIKIKG